MFSALLMAVLLHRRPYSEQTPALDFIARFGQPDTYADLHSFIDSSCSDLKDSAEVTPNHAGYRLHKALASPPLSAGVTHQEQSDGMHAGRAVPMSSNLEDLWPTPQGPVWADIETVAVRALVTLEWANEEGSAALESGHSQTWAQLRLVLIMLIHALLKGHVLDPNLNMTWVFKFGFLAVMREAADCPANTDGMRCIRQLAWLFLRRLSTDKMALSVLSQAKGNSMELTFQQARNRHAVESIWELIGEMKNSCPCLTADTFCCVGHRDLHRSYHVCS